MTVPYTFANISGQIPLSELDANFAAVNEHVITAGTVTTNAQPNVTSVGTLVSLAVTGNVTADYFFGNIIGSFSNAVYANTAGIANSALIANVANIAYSVAGSNVVGPVANATYAVTTGSTSYANVANVANIAYLVDGANVTGTVANATYALIANVSTYAGTITTNAQPNITSVGTLSNLSIAQDLAIDGNGSIGTNAIIYGYANIGGALLAVGNITGNNIVAAGGLLVNQDIVGTNLSVIGNVEFYNGSKFSTASWLNIEGYTANLASGANTVSTTYPISYYTSIYNEVLYMCESGGVGGTITIPINAVSANTVWNVNNRVGIQWANIYAAQITLVDLIPPLGNVTVTMYAR